MEQKNKTDRIDEMMEIARLRFGMIAPMIQETYPDEFVMTYWVNIDCAEVNATFLGRGGI